jgi:hypothetical protein
MLGTYLDRSFQLKEDGLRDEDLAGLCTKIANLGLKKLHLLSGTAATDLEQPVDYGVEIDFVLVCHFMFSRFQSEVVVSGGVL